MIHTHTQPEVKLNVIIKAHHCFAPEVSPAGLFQVCLELPVGTKGKQKQQSDM